MSEVLSEAEVIENIAFAGGLKYQEFCAASGIKGNFKIELPEALSLDNETTQYFIGDINQRLKKAEVYVATGGAVSIAAAAAAKVDKPLVVIEAFKLGDEKHFRLSDEGWGVLSDASAAAVIEDVSSTFSTVERALGATCIGQVIEQVVTCWRRGQEAPENMAIDEIDWMNQALNYRKLYEHRMYRPDGSRIPVSGIIERFIPLWVPLEKQVANYLPELAVA